MKKLLTIFFCAMTLCTMASEVNITSKVESGVFTQTPLPTGPGRQMNWLSLEAGFLRMGTVRSADFNSDTVVYMQGSDSTLVGMGITAFRVLLNSGYLRLQDSSMYIKNQTGSTLQKQTGKLWVSDTIETSLDFQAGRNVNVAGNITTVGQIQSTGGPLIVKGYIKLNNAAFQNVTIDGTDVTYDARIYKLPNKAANDVIAMISDITAAGAAEVMTRTGTTVTPTVTSDNISTTGNITGSNLGGTLSTNAQPNITSVGTLISLIVTNTLTSGKVSTGAITGTTAAISGLVRSNSLTTVGGITSGARLTANDGITVFNGPLIMSSNDITGIGTASGNTASFGVVISPIGLFTSLTSTGNIYGQSNLLVTGNITAAGLTLTGGINANDIVSTGFISSANLIVNSTAKLGAVILPYGSGSAPPVGNASIAASTDSGYIFQNCNGCYQTKIKGAATALTGNREITWADETGVMGIVNSGTFTPTDGSGAGLTFSTAQGNYQKLNGYAYLTIKVTYPVTANGSNAIVNNLPFTPLADNSTFSGGVTYTDFTGQIGALTGSGAAQNLFPSFAAGGFYTNAQLSGKTIIYWVKYKYNP